MTEDYDSNRSDSQKRIDQWVDDHAQFLFRYCLPRVPDHNVAEDIVQETFLAAASAASSFRGESSSRTWLVGLLRRKIVDYFRSIHKEGEPIPATDAVIDGWFNAAGHWIEPPRCSKVDPSTLHERVEFWTVVRKCLTELPGRQARAFSLRVLEEMDSREVCKVLAVSPTNLWVLLHRARSRLRACLQARWFDETESEQR